MSGVMSESTTGRLPWQSMEPDAVARELRVDPEVGLDSRQVGLRTAEFGSNALATEPPVGVWSIVLSQFRDLMILVLIAAALISAAVGDVKDAVVIVAIVVLNATVGAVQRFRAEKALEALRLLVPQTSRVRRGGAIVTVRSAELVPGDVVFLAAGTAVPADLRLVTVEQLIVDESALTGESEAVRKQVEAVQDTGVPARDRRNIACNGTLVSHGRAIGLVIATGRDTELGRIAAMLREARAPRTPLQQRLARFGRHLSIVVVLICAVLFFAGILRGESTLLMFLTAVSLAVAAIPEALPAVVTVSLALGARKLSKAGALIRRLSAVETLGSVTVICADKTGTLTENRMQVDFVEVAGRRYDRLSCHAAFQNSLLGVAMALSNDIQVDGRGQAHGDPTELAVYEFSRLCGFDRRHLVDEYPRLREEPFSNRSRRMVTVHDGPHGPVTFLKGAPESIVPLCAGWPDAGLSFSPAAALEDALRIASEGFRVLAIAGRGLSDHGDAGKDNLVLYGLVALSDPPRPAVEQAVGLCRSAGIRPLMITGDHPATALAIARRVGIADDGDCAVTGDELALLGDAELASVVRHTRVFARVEPAQKIRIVEALRANGEFVAMTGDGVNDAPALKHADIGVAMGNKGTDVAREAADMVLLDDNFATIVAAVREGRRIFDNVLKFVRYAMTGNSGEIWTMFLAPFLGLPIPLLPVHILWINLVTDGLPGLALASEPADPHIMRRGPRPPARSIFADGMWQHIIWVGLAIGGLAILAQAWAIGRGYENWRTVVFTVLTFSQLAHVLAIRSDRLSLFSRAVQGNLPLLLCILLTVALQFAVIYLRPLQEIFGTAALTAAELAVCLALPAMILLGVELEKLMMRRGWIYRLPPRSDEFA